MSTDIAISGDSTTSPTPTPLPPVVPVALGQPDFTTSASRTTSATTLNGGEFKIHSDGTRLLVADFTENRVLIWNSIPETFNKPADVVLGQTDLSGNLINRGGLPTASTLNSPGGVYTDGTKVYVADFGNNRILIWNSFPTTNGAPADIVLGQNDFVSNSANAGGLSSASLHQPWHLFVHGSRLFVSDYTNNRVLIWNSLPTTNKQAADVVVGQANMTSNSSGIGATTASSLSGAYEITTDGTKLVIADSGCYRVLIWNSIPSSNGAAADIVLGQANFTANSALPSSASTVGYPTSVSIVNGKLHVTDTQATRVLTWNQIPTVSNSNANFVFGQPDFTTDTIRPADKDSLGGDTEGLFVNSRFAIIGDPSNRRVLILPASAVGH